MKNAFQVFKRILFILIAFSLVSADAWALGQLTLIARTEDGKIKLSLIEEEGHYFGEIREGLTVVTPIEAIYDLKTLKIGIGELDYIIERWQLGKYISYGGVIQDERGISAQAEFAGPKMTISGTIEDDLNKLIEFEVVVNDKKGSMELHWDEKYLFLKKTPKNKPGTCRGGLIQEDLNRLGRFWCSSSGSLQDAFFKDPDQILAWIVALFVK
ncbi:MAG: hypothetical protein NPINA01_13650 [Nitrospinaceae bacterium]|nr:MAG: hypothetical protein NPINA01_13650 [Nitrospinaceae bacterium]